MVCRIAFLQPPSKDRRVAGRHISTQELVKGLRAIGVKAFCTKNLKAKADYYAVDCLDNIKWLPNVEPSRRIAWARRDVYHLTDRPAIEGVGHLFASSHFVARAWKDYPVTVLPDPVHIPSWIRPHIRHRLLYVGRVCRSKGIPLLLKALKFQHGLNHLTIAGPIVEDFQQMVRNYQLTYHVKFTGELSHWQVLRLYRQSKCVIVPSQAEPFGRAIVEAWANGCTPIAIAGSGGPEETLRQASLDKFPYLVEHDPKRLSDAISRVTGADYDGISHRLDYDHCRQLAAPYEASVIAQRFMDHLGRAH